jgi:hypothetical protein
LVNQLASQKEQNGYLVNQLASQKEQNGYLVNQLASQKEKLAIKITLSPSERTVGYLDTNKPVKKKKWLSQSIKDYSIFGTVIL